MKPNEAKELEDAKSNIRNLKHYGTGGTFLDLGANIGEVTRTASVQFKKVVAVEAHPETYKRMCKRLQGLVNVTTVNRAVFDTCFQKMFMSSPENSTGAAASLKKRLKTAHYYLMVESISLGKLLKKYKPRVIKMDIEGSEYASLLSCDINKECEWLSIEFHQTRSATGWKKCKAVHRSLRKQGFKRVKPLKVNTSEDGTYALQIFFVALYHRKEKV